MAYPAVLLNTQLQKCTLTAVVLQYTVCNIYYRKLTAIQNINMNHLNYPLSCQDDEHDHLFLRVKTKNHPYMCTSPEGFN